MPQVTDNKYVVTAGWDDVPHLDERTKKRLLEETPRYQRDARSKGTPSLGAGAIYPFEESDIVVSPFAIPAYWRRCYGLDVGWNKTAATFIAIDPADGTAYVYAEHYMGQERPTVHATAIKARGAWIPGVIDPASRGRQQTDGAQLMQNYRDLGLLLFPADNAVSAGLWSCEERFGTGRLKIFSSCRNTISEWRLYRRDENGKIIKKFDHAMDAMRYGVHSGIAIARVQPVVKQTVIDRVVGVDDTVGY